MRNTSESNRAPSWRARTWVTTPDSADAAGACPGGRARRPRRRRAGGTGPGASATQNDSGRASSVPRTRPTGAITPSPSLRPRPIPHPPPPCVGPYQPSRVLGGTQTSYPWGIGPTRDRRPDAAGRCAIPSPAYTSGGQRAGTISSWTARWRSSPAPGAGIGAATARGLAEAGADVVLASRTAEQLDAVAGRGPRLRPARRSSCPTDVERERRTSWRSRQPRSRSSAASTSS